jgi:N-acyl-D-aspartate/D-glutamate deacylase
MQLISDFDDPEQTFAMLRRLVECSGRPLSVSLLEGTYGPMTLKWRDVLDWAAAASASGLPIKAQVLSRAIGVMLGHELTLNTFYTCATYVQLASLPFDEKIRALKAPETRARILAESADPDPAIVLGRLAREFDHMFLLGDPPDYEQPFEQSIAARAKRQRVSPEALVYDLMLEREGRNNLYVTLCNYEHGPLDSSLESRLPGFGSATAAPTHDLGWQLSDVHADALGPRPRGERLPLATVVKWLTRHDTAWAVSRRRNPSPRVQGGHQCSTSIIFAFMRPGRTICRAADGARSARGRLRGDDCWHRRPTRRNITEALPGGWCVRGNPLHTLHNFAQRVSGPVARVRCWRCP